jgi:hypothetical protein
MPELTNISTPIVNNAQRFTDSVTSIPWWVIAIIIIIMGGIIYWLRKGKL